MSEGGESAGPAGRLRVAIMSDLHAYEGEVDPPPSWLNSAATGTNPLLHPIAGLEQLVTEEPDLQADLLLCPGDLGDKAQRGGVLHGWQMVQRVRAALGTPQVIATVGNHDVSSRPTGPDPDADPTETLRGLSPLYPYDDRPTQQAFFSDYYAIVTGDTWRVVALNSSAHHVRGEREYDHGRVTPDTRQRLMNDLRAAGPCPLNLLLLHHHPMEYTDVDEPDRSTVVGGALLLTALAQADLGPWVIVHGHKHVPNLAYAPGSGSSPVVFSAGSLSATFHLNQQPITRNQFYWLEFDFDAAAELTAMVLCRFRSWYWVPSRGWIPTDPGSGLPAAGGFGARVDPRWFANKVLAAVRDSGAPALDWSGLLEVCPEAEFLIPSDLDAVAAELERIGCGVRRDKNGRYEEVAAPWP